MLERWVVRIDNETQRYHDGTATSVEIQATYSVALWSDGAILFIYSGHGESFQMLPSYLKVVRQHNPDTMTELDIKDVHIESKKIDVDVVIYVICCNMNRDLWTQKHLIYY